VEKWRTANWYEYSFDSIVAYSSQSGSMSIGQTFLQNNPKNLYCPLNDPQIHYSAPAIFMDCTHDNQTPYQKRTTHDFLSNAAITCMSSCAIGSTKGYDEFYPSHLDLVREGRLYSLCKNDDTTLSPGTH
jgi:hypothetical protein